MTSPVSVVIPAYNGVEFLTETLQSVWEQTHLPREVIVVDDASTDDTPHLVESLASSAPIPVRLIRLSRNFGSPTRPMNVGIGSASGEFISVLDQDDKLLPSKLESQVKVLTGNPELSFVFSFSGWYHHPGETVSPAPEVQQLLSISEDRKSFRRMEGPAALRLFMLRENYACGYSGFLFRRKHWKQKGGIDESLVITSDYDFLCWLSTRGPVGIIPQIEFLRREHGGNLSNREPLRSLEAARVKSTYLGRQRWLLKDPDVFKEFQDFFLGLGTHLRNGGYHLDALRCYYYSCRLWGWERKTMWSTLQLARSWVAHKFRGQIQDRYLQAYLPTCYREGR
jgi:glycosyltransferase involved in cell wall biosynthesis